MNYPPWACGPTPLRSKGAPAAAGQSPFRAGCWVWSVEVVRRLRLGFPGMASDAGDEGTTCDAVAGMEAWKLK